MALSRGIDVSHYQGVVDWQRLKSTQGLTWGACKATEGLSYVDPQFARNWPNMRAAGLTRIAYHFARPGSSSGTAQAARFLAVVKPVAGDVLCLDLEKSDGRTQTEVNTFAREFASYVRAHAGLNVLVLYAGAGYVANGTGRGLAALYDYWWYPRYPSSTPTKSWRSTFAPGLPGGMTTGWRTPHVWQWTAWFSTIAGQVDANLSTLTAAQLRTRPGTAPVTQEDEVTPADIDAIANAVIKKLMVADAIPAPARTDVKNNPTWGFATFLHYLGEWELQNRDLAQEHKKDLDDLRATVEGIATTAGEQVATAITAELAKLRLGFIERGA